MVSMLLLFFLHSWLFWIEYGFDGAKIERTDLSGENRILIKNLFIHGHVYTLAMTVDYAKQKLYWIDFDTDEIYSTGYSGLGTRFEHVTIPNLRPHSMAFFDNVVFWSDWNSQSIERLDVGRQPTRHLQNMGWLSYEELRGIAVFNLSSQPEGKLGIRVDIADHENSVNKYYRLPSHTGRQVKRIIIELLLTWRNQKAPVKTNRAIISVAASKVLAAMAKKSPPLEISVNEFIVDQGNKNTRAKTELRRVASARGVSYCQERIKKARGTNTRSSMVYLSELPDR